MKRTVIILLAVALLTLSAGQLLAVQTGTWSCMGYTIVVTPDSPEDPSLSGTIAITKSDDYAVVAVSGTYLRTIGNKPATVVNVAGTITTPDGVREVARTFTFQQSPQKSVWRTICSWIEGQIAS